MIMSEHSCTLIISEGSYPNHTMQKVHILIISEHSYIPIILEGLYLNRTYQTVHALITTKHHDGYFVVINVCTLIVIVTVSIMYIHVSMLLYVTHLVFPFDK